MPIDPAYASAIKASTGGSKYDDGTPLFKFGAIGTGIKGVITAIDGPKELKNKQKDAAPNSTYMALIMTIESKDSENPGTFKHFLSGGFRWENLGTALETANLSKLEVGDFFYEYRTGAEPGENGIKWLYELKVQRPSAG